MSVFNIAERPENWYVSRNAIASDEGLAQLQPGHEVVGRHGSILTVVSLGKVDIDSGAKVYQASLSHFGRIPAKHPIQLVVSSVSPEKVEIGLQLTEGKPGRLVSAQRYFTSAWSILDALAEELRRPAFQAA